MSVSATFQNRRWLALVAACLFAAACTPTLPTGPGNTGTTKKEKKESPAPSASPSVSPSASPSPSLLAFTGQVLGIDGSPAAGVPIRGYLVSNNGSSLIGNNGSGYRVAQAGGTSAVSAAWTGEAKTDAQGRFTLSHPEGLAINIEAVKDVDVKAIQLNVASTSKDVKLQLAKTGSIAGKVSAPKAPTVTDFEGVEVFIPGTSYSARAAKDGSYTLTNVPVGAFTLVATKTGLGRAEAAGVKVESEKSTAAPDLALSVAAPVVTSLSPANGGEGATVVVTGTDFGAVSGKTFSVTLGGVAATSPTRDSDTQITLKVPANASAAGVVVTVDGIASNPIPFAVIKSLFVPTRSRHMKLGTSVTPMVLAEDAEGEAIATPALTWTSQDTAVAYESGKLSAKSVGSATLKVTSGNVSQTAVVKVYDAPAALVTLAGGEVDYEEGLGEAARFKHARGIAVAPDGTIYVADEGNQRIRRITPDGRVTTIAGTGSEGYTDGPGANAQFNGPTSVALDPEAGLLFVADRYNHRVRQIDLNDAGFKVTTYAGDGTQAHTNGPRQTAQFKLPSLVEVSPAGVVFVTESNTGIVRKIGLDGMVGNFSGVSVGLADGGPTTAQFSSDLADMTFDANGNMYVADGSRIRKVTADGTVTTLAGGTRGQADGIGADAKFQYLSTLAFDGDNTLYIGEVLPIYDDGAGNLRKLNLTTREVTQWLYKPGSVDGPLGTAGLGHPADLVFDANGDLVLLDTTSYDCRVRLFRFFE